MKAYLILILFSSFLIQCGEEKKVSLEENFKTLSGEVSVSREGVISGTGSLVFQKRFIKIFDRKSFKITFKLKPQSRIKVHLFSDEQLDNGLDIYFTWNKKNRLEIQFSHDDYFASVDKGPVINYKDKNGFISFTIDLYNDTYNAYGIADSHVLIWSNKISSFYVPSSAILIKYLEFRLKGGFFWGMGLEDSSVSKAVSGGPVYSDEQAN